MFIIRKVIALNIIQIIIIIEMIFYLALLRLMMCNNFSPCLGELLSNLRV